MEHTVVEIVVARTPGNVCMEMEVVEVYTVLYYVVSGLLLLLLSVIVIEMVELVSSICCFWESVLMVL